MKIKPLLPLLPILLGILFTLFLLSKMPQGFYFSGDAGLKALLAQQLAQGRGRFDLIPPPQTWVQNLWQQGLYPYQPPYVYDLDSGYFIAFPFAFPLVTAPFYRLFGYFGLYIIPALAAWTLWGSFYWACRLLEFSSFWTTLSLGLLIFASPFTLYSALYWEHSLAVSLAFTGLVLILWAKQQEKSLSLKISISLVALAGIALGLAAWFRQEFICLIGLIIAIAAGQELLKLPITKKFINMQGLKFSTYLIPHPWVFILSTVITAGLYFISNKIIYNNYFGVPRIEMFGVTTSQKIHNAITGSQSMGITFIIFMPIVCFIVFYGFALLFNNPRLKPNLFLLSIYILSLILLGGIAYLVPAGTAGLIPGGQQWGVRFLLILVPILILTTVQSLRFVLNNCQSWLRYSGIALFSGLMLLTIHKNTVEGSVYLFKKYQNVAPIINFLNESPESVVAISQQFVGQAIEASLKEKKLWFKVETPDDLEKLGQGLLKENLNQFLYVCYPHAPCPLPKSTENQLNISYQQRSHLINFKFLGEMGKYPVYQGSIHLKMTDKS